ncbi:MAG: energy transducer TonB [Candidatus Zixiibacteriota bacterium]
MDTIDCEYIRKNTTIDDDSIPPQPPSGVFLYEKEPELLYDCIPDYPSKAVKHKKTAEVSFQAYIDKSGCVLRVEITSCTTPGYGFEDAVIECVYSRKYIPVIIDDKPIGLWISEKMEFALP